VLLTGLAAWREEDKVLAYRGWVPTSLVLLGAGEEVGG